MDRDCFRRTTDLLVDDVLLASIHLELLTDLNGYLDKYQQEFDQTPTFWWLTFRAHHTSALARLLRVFDSDDRSLTLPRWIRLIRKHWDTLEVSKPAPPEEEMAADIAIVSRDDPMVSRLILARNKLFAHHDLKIAMGVRRIEDDERFTQGDMEALTGRAYDVLQKYGGLVLGTSWSRKMHNGDDFQGLLRAMRYYVEGTNRDVRRAMGLDGGTAE